jgi:hypothetical protein
MTFSIGLAALIGLSEWKRQNSEVDRKTLKVSPL